MLFNITRLVCSSFEVRNVSRITAHFVRHQTILYKSLGIDSTTILALAGVYGTCAFVSNAITTKFLTDQWGRRPMILTGLAGVVVIEIYAAVMQNTNNKVGKGFAVLGIYLFVVTYCEYPRPQLRSLALVC
jgi:MFS family permease